MHSPFMCALWTFADHVNLAATAAQGTSMNWSGLERKCCLAQADLSARGISAILRSGSGLTVCSLTKRWDDVQNLKQNQGRKTLGVPGSGDLQRLESTFVIIHWTSVPLHLNLKGAMCFYRVWFFCSRVLTFPYFSRKRTRSQWISERHAW